MERRHAFKAADFTQNFGLDNAAQRLRGNHNGGVTHSIRRVVLGLMLKFQAVLAETPIIRRLKRIKMQQTLNFVIAHFVLTIHARAIMQPAIFQRVQPSLLLQRV